MRPSTGNRVHAGDAGLVREITLEFQDILGERVGRSRVPAQCVHRVLVRTGRSSKSEVDSSGVHRGQGAELLGDEEWSVVREHHATGAKADVLGLCTDMGDEHARRRRGDARDVVVFGVPNPVVAGLLGLLGERHAAGEAVTRRLVRAYGCQVENGEGNSHLDTSDGSRGRDCLTLTGEETATTQVTG